MASPPHMCIFDGVGGDSADDQGLSVFEVDRREGRVGRAQRDRFCCVAA